MKRSDRELGMDRAITRRDFISGVGVAVTGSALAGPWTGSRFAQAARVAQSENPAAAGASGLEQEAGDAPPGAPGSGGGVSAGAGPLDHYSVSSSSRWPSGS